MSLIGESDEAKRARYLVQRNYARTADSGQTAVATLSGVQLLRRYYNAMTLEQGVERHLVALAKKKELRDKERKTQSPLRVRVNDRPASRLLPLSFCNRGGIHAY